MKWHFLPSHFSHSSRSMETSPREDKDSSVSQKWWSISLSSHPNTSTLNKANWRPKFTSPTNHSWLSVFPWICPHLKHYSYPQTLFLPTTQVNVLYDAMSKSAGAYKCQSGSPAGKESPHLLELISLFWQCQRPPPGEFWVKLYSLLKGPLLKEPHLFLLSPMSLLPDLLPPLFSTCSLALLLSSAFQ